MNSTDAISALQVLVDTFKGQIAQLQGGIDAIGWVIAGLKNVLKNIIKDESL